MSTDLTWQTESLSNVDVAVLSSCALGIADAVESLVHAIAESGPGLDCRALRDVGWEGNPENAEGSTHLESAHKSTRTMCRAATDHLRAFSYGIRTGQTTVSNWTLARGAVESFGTAHFMLGTESPAELLGRYVALVLEETKYSRGQMFAYRYGDLIGVDDYRQGMKDLLSERRIPLPVGASPTAVARTVIDDAAPGSDGRLRYSHLSAVAHGQAPGVHMFMPNETGAIASPRNLALDAAHIQIACAALVGDELVAYFAPEEGAQTLWRTRRDRVIGEALSHGGVHPPSAS
ncbi:hypothetical protein [Microbacterium sp. A1-JK]|uniref:hypothetical protein n=1 Tax=Microbacterium sp. A1-JK TaxID=3177516 RepID=UPI00388B6125